MSKSVTLSLDGQSTEVRVLGAPSATSSRAEGIKVGERDVVAPASTPR